MSLTNWNVLTVVGWIIAAGWMAIISMFAAACRKRLTVKSLRTPVEHDNVQRLTVMVAARNESASIETCIRSLFRQDYPDFEVIAVNDRSTDDTGQILDRLAKEFEGRLKAVHVTSLAPGWFGKPHALTRGLQSATGDLVCFTDADCQFLAPSALRTAVAELSQRQLDFMSVAARYKMTTLRENVAVPCCSEALLTWLRPERIEDPKWPDAFANGAFILVRKQPFDQIGGWGAVRTMISEDLQLARLYKRSGLKVGLIQGDGFYETRAYDSLRDSWNGWSRIFKGVLTPAQLMITFARMMILFVMPLASTFWGVCEYLSTGTALWLTSGPGLPLAIAFVTRTCMDLALFRVIGARITAALLAPVGRLYVMAITLRALFSHAGLVHTHWRGAVFSAGQLVLPRRVKT